MNDVFLPIVTKRLSLRLLDICDSADMFAARRESYAELSKWGTLIWSPLDQMTQEENDIFCRMKAAQFDAGTDITVLAFDRGTGRLIGGGGIHKIDAERMSGSLGFWVRSSETHKGFATEIAKALIDYAFHTLEFETLTSFHGDGNTGSQRVLEKVGFMPQVLRVDENFHYLCPAP